MPKPNTMHDPIIVTGMMRSGTTLLAEMVHKGGTPMFVETPGIDASYDSGIKYERPLTHDLDLAILGLARNTIGMKIVSGDWKLQPLPEAAFAQLEAEVGTQPWGFKNPRTSLTYPMWRQAFPGGKTLYIYRSHQEVLRYHFSSRSQVFRRYKRMCMAARAWVIYNEQIVNDMRLDQKDKRPAALVRYEALMSQPAMVARLEAATGVPLFDARDPKLRRNTLRGEETGLFYRLATRGLEKRIKAVYEALDALRLQ